MLAKLDGREIHLAHGDIVPLWDDELPVYFEQQPTVPELQTSKGATIETLRPEGTKWAWWPCGPPDQYSADRRYGLFTVGVGGLSVRFDFRPRQFFHHAQYLSMLRDLSAWLPAAMLDDRDLGVSLPTPLSASKPQESLRALAAEVTREHQVASHIVRRPYSELAPVRPTPGVEAGVTHELPENAVVVRWAEVSARVLEEWSAAFESAADILSAEISAAAGSTAPWVRDLSSHISEMRAAASETRALRSRVLRTGRQARTVVGSLRWTPVPAVRRRSGPARLVRGIGRSAHPPTAGVAAVLSPRPVSFVFESWAAWTIARMVQAAGFELLSAPRAATTRTVSDSLVLPHIATWSFDYKGVRLHWQHGIRALSEPLTRRGLLLDDVEATAVAAASRGVRNAFVGVGKTLTPDYALVAEYRGRCAWVVGDAVFADPRQVSAKGRLGGVPNKLDQIRQKYVRGLAWLDSRGRPVLPARAGSFAVIPAPRDDYADIDKILEYERTRHVAAVPIVPGALDAGHLLRVIETLLWRVEAP